MERQGETERATLYRFTRMWLILSMVLTLTVGLWYPAEGATSDTFKPIELVPGDAYNPGIAIVTGMKSTGLVIGQYFPNTGEPGMAEWLGYRGLGAAFRMLPLLEPKAINDTNALWATIRPSAILVSRMRRAFAWMTRVFASSAFRTRR
jgi:hypothetical protein